MSASLQQSGPANSESASFVTGSERRPAAQPAGGRPEGSWKWVQGETGQVSPCRRFAARMTTQAKGGGFAALVPAAAKQLSLRPWRLVALPSSLSLSRQTPASP